MPASGRVWLLALAVGAATAVPALLLAPHAPPPTAAFSGDDALVAELESVVDPDTVQGLSVARFPIDDPDAVERAVAGTAREDTLFETASVFKTITAMTLADMVESGETSLDRTLAEVFPDADFADPEVASATLEELATHHSGLPTAPGGDVFGQQILPALTMADPYRSAEPPLEALAFTEAGTKGEYTYSNLGYSVLGEALAAESGTPYPDLVRERVLDPLDMDDTFVHAGVPEGAAEPNVEPGAPTHPWHNTDYAPAGITTWSTTPDLTRLLGAVTSGTAPGMDALEPLREGVAFPGVTAEMETGLDDFDLGLAWHTAQVPGVGEVTMHSGGSLGTSTMVAFDDSHGVVVMANSMSLDAIGLSYELLKDEPEPLVPAVPGWALLAQTLVMTAVPPVLLVCLMLRRRTLVAQRRLDRLRIVSLSTGALAWLVAAQRMGSWMETPVLVWAVAAGLVAAGITVGAWHWRRVPVEAGRFRWLHVPVFALSVLFSLTLGSVALWGLAGSSF